MESSAFLLLGIATIGAIIYILTVVTRLTTLALEAQARLQLLDSEVEILRDNLDSSVEAFSFEIDSLRKRCEALEN